MSYITLCALQYLHPWQSTLMSVNLWQHWTLHAWLNPKRVRLKHLFEWKCFMVQRVSLILRKFNTWTCANASTLSTPQYLCYCSQSPPFLKFFYRFSYILFYFILLTSTIFRCHVNMYDSLGWCNESMRTTKPETCQMMCLGPLICF